MILANIIGNPSIELVQNNEGVVCASLMDWDITEMEDSYTLKEVNELIVALERAKTAMKLEADEQQMKLNYGDNQ